MTKKIKKAFELLESVGSMGEAMRQAGYSKATAKNPDHLTKRKGFRELLEQYGPKLEDAFATTNRLMGATKLVLSPTEPDREWPDWQAQAKGAEQTYKIHGVYNDDNPTIQGDLNITYVFRDPRYTQSSGNNDESSQVQDAQLAQKSQKNNIRNGEANL